MSKWSKPAAPPPPLFLGQKERNLVKQVNDELIENIIKSHPAIFHEIYFTRNVNNIYFDTVDFSSFIDNIEGIRDRKKSKDSLVW